MKDFGIRKPDAFLNTAVCLQSSLTGNYRSFQFRMKKKKKKIPNLINSLISN